jgi:hypothetical protein
VNPSEACDALHARAAAAAGRSTEFAGLVAVEETLDTMVRRLMNGLVEPEEFEELERILAHAAAAALLAVVSGGTENVQANLAGVLAQMVALGLLLGKGRS